MQVNYAQLAKPEAMAPKWHLALPKELLNVQHNIVYVVAMKVCQSDRSYMLHQTGFARI